MLKTILSVIEGLVVSTNTLTTNSMDRMVLHHL